MRPEPERSRWEGATSLWSSSSFSPSSSSSSSKFFSEDESGGAGKVSEHNPCSLWSTLPRSTTIQHWQLRDLVQCPYSRTEVFSVQRNRIVRHDLETMRSSTVRTLGFEPTCFAIADDCFAAGGQASQFELRNGNEIVFEGSTGGSVNNAVRIAKDHSGQARVFVCNNDESIKIHAIDTGRFVGFVRCVTAVNHCSIRPGDGRDLVCVGDNRHTYLYTARPTGYTPVHIYTEATDAGMSCDWSPSGWLFAAAFQDGLTAVWDIRCQSPITKFYTSLACRSVRFSPAPLDLLAFSEHRERIHIADSRMWPRQQIVNVGATAVIEPDIAGFCFSPCGRRLFVGTDETLLMYNVDTSSRRSFAKAEIL